MGIDVPLYDGSIFETAKGCVGIVMSLILLYKIKVIINEE